MTQKELVIMTGNIGSGKSLIASKYAKNGYVIVSMDSIQAMVGGGEYGLYDNEKKDIYHATESSAIVTALDHGLSVVVDRTNMDAGRRSRYIEKGKIFDAKIISYDFGLGDIEGFKRRIKNSHGIPEQQWMGVLHYMQENYQKPSLDEGFDQIIQAPEKYYIYAFDFDGTLVENRYPEIGELKPDKVENLRFLWQDHSNIIIIWTCRHGDQINQMRAFLLKNKIPFDFINENPIFDAGSRKVFAHEYWDDRNKA